MTQPKRPTKEPKPIGRHPHAGQYAVVVSFRVAADPNLPKRAYRVSIERTLREAYTIADLDVAIRELGAGGEASEHEIWPPFGPLARTEDDVETVRTTKDQDTIDPGDRL